MASEEKKQPLIDSNPKNDSNPSQYQLYQHSIIKLIMIGVSALSSGVLYWDTNKKPGLRYQGYLNNSTLAPFAPIFPVIAQLGGSLTNAFFNYVAFLDLSKQFREPITQSYSENCNRLNWFIHWGAALCLGFFTTLPQWNIGLQDNMQNDIPESISSLFNGIVNMQGASCLLKTIWNLLSKKALNDDSTQTRNMKIQAILSANLSLEDTKALLNAKDFDEEIEKIYENITKVAPQSQLTCAKKVGINTVTGLLGLLGLWMNVGICMQAYTATDNFLNKIGLPSLEAIKLISVACNIICSLGYYLLCIKSLMSTLKSFCSSRPNSVEQHTTIFSFNIRGQEKSITLSNLFTVSATLIACFSLFSGFTVDQMTYDSFETLPTQWRFAPSFCANLGAALCYNMFQSIRLPREFFIAILPLTPKADPKYQDAIEYYELKIRLQLEKNRPPEEPMSPRPNV